MTVNTEPSRIPSNGDGVSVTFPANFYFLDAKHLAVFVDGVRQKLDIDYAVSGAGNPSGGSVTFTSAPAAGSGNVVILRDPDQAQEVKYPPNDPFPARTHETALDKLTMLVQRTRDLLGRAFTLADADASQVSLTVPTPQAGYLIGWNPSGTGLANFAGTGGGSTLPLPVSIANGGTGAASAAAARTALGLGSAALANTGVAAGNAVLLDGSARLPAVDGSQLTNLPIPAPPVAVPVRQTVLGGATDANGYANWLAAGTGLQVNYLASAAPVRIAFASGYGDLVSDLTADAASQFGALAPNLTSFLFADRASAAAISGGATLVQPQYGYTFDRTRHALLHFDGSNGATTTTDDWGNSWTLTAATISTAQAKFGASSLALNGSTAYADTTGVQSLGGGSWTIEAFFRRGTAGTLQILCENTNAGNWGMRLGLTTGNFLYCDLSSSGSSNDIGTITGAMAVTVDSLWHHAAITYDALAGKYFLYLDGVSQGTPITSAARICAAGGTRVGATRNTAASFFNGFIDEFRLSPFCAYPNGVTFTPPGSAFSVTQAGQQVHWFDIPRMTMREVAGPSSSAGTNPAFTTRNRVFCGEADCGASTVSALRNYAYCRQYRSGLVGVPAVSTRTAFATNLGIDPQFVTIKAWLRFNGAWNGYNAGMCVPLTMYYLGTNPPGLDPQVIEDQNTCTVLTNTGGVVIPIPRTAPNSYLSIAAGTGTAQLFVEACSTF